MMSQERSRGCCKRLACRHPPWRGTLCSFPSPAGGRRGARRIKAPISAAWPRDRLRGGIPGTLRGWSVGQTGGERASRRDLQGLEERRPLPVGQLFPVDRHPGGGQADPPGGSDILHPRPFRSHGTRRRYRLHRTRCSLPQAPWSGVRHRQHRPPVADAIALFNDLHGQMGFGKMICVTVMGGWDTDCTGATAGSVLRAMLEADRLPAK